MKTGKYNLVDYRRLPVGFDISSRVPNILHWLRIPECFVAHAKEGVGFLWS